MAKVLQPQDSFAGAFSPDTLNGDDQQLLSRLQLRKFSLRLLPQLVTSLPICGDIQLLFGFHFCCGVPADHRNAVVIWETLAARPRRITIDFGAWPYLKLVVIEDGRGNLAPSFAEPWRLRILGGQLDESLPPGGLTGGCYVLQNAAADKAGW